jgi:hypothetical protein
MLTDIPAAGERGQRYSQRPLPDYRYVPTLHPHPTRDPHGHSYQAAPRLNHHAPWSSDEWPTLDDWLYGIDLFNRFYFWEAHEAWEGLWAAAERGSAPAMLVQGLIQIAAALLKTHMGACGGAAMLSARGVDNLRRVAETAPCLLGLDVPAMTARFTAYFAPLERDELPTIGPQVPVLHVCGWPGITSHRP